jgi:protein TonB
MDRRRADLAVGALLALALHGAVLGAIAQRSSRAVPTTGPSLARESPVTWIDAKSARALLEVRVASGAPRLREAAEASHAPSSPPPSAQRAMPTPLDPLPVQGLARAEVTSADRTEPTASSTRLAPPPRTVPASEGPTAKPAETREATGVPANEAAAAPAATREPPDLDGAGALVVHRPPLGYPEAARRRAIEGVARVGLEVGASGAVARVWLLRSSGSRTLDRAALENVEAWVFDPEAVHAARQGWVFRQDVRFALH